MKIPKWSDLLYRAYVNTDFTMCFKMMDKIEMV